MHNDTQVFKKILEPQGAVAYLRNLKNECLLDNAIHWGLLEEICMLHFEGVFVNFQQHLKVRNSTGIATILEEEAHQLTLTLPTRMTAPNPLSATEAERLVYQITLMRMIAMAARALHREEAVVIEF